jgi:uncharacterized protein YabN with tetrapyrrole methylase and pyrophosphatase domain
MDSRLADFLVAVSTDAPQRAAFESDPESAMAAAGLTDAERAAVRSRDPRHIHAALSGRVRGRLTVVGTGVRPDQLTSQALLALELAEKVFYLVPDRPTVQRIHALNATAESLMPLVMGTNSAEKGSQPLAEIILAPVRRGLTTCAAFFGHPVMLTGPVPQILRTCREEGHEVEVLPGVSMQDCLYADLGVDPGQGGCQSFDSTDFLIHRRRYDPTSHLILWQIGAIGCLASESRNCSHGLELLAEVLRETYPEDHEVRIYEAVTEAGPEPRILDLPLRRLPEGTVSLYSILYVPPLPARLPDPAILARLGVVPRRTAE